MDGASIRSPATARKERSLSRRLASIVVVPIVAALVALTFTGWFVWDVADFPAEVMLSGRQRVLALRFAVHGPPAARGSLDDLAKLRRARDEFEQTTTLLEHGGTYEGARVDALYGEAAASLVNVRATWTKLRPELDRILSEVPSWGSASLDRDRLSTQAEQLVVAAEGTSRALERQMGARGMRFTASLWLIGAVCFAFLVSTLHALGRHIVPRLRAARDAAHAITAGDFSHRLPVDSDDELGHLAEAHNTMAAKLQGLVGQIRRAAADAEILRESLPLAAIVVDEQGLVLSFNRAFGRVFGVEDDTATHGTLSGFFGHGIADRLLDASRWNASADPLSFELPKASGDYGIFRVTYLPTRVGPANEPAIALLFEELSEAQHALRRSEASFRALIERSPDAIAVHRDGRFVYVNPALVAILGYDSPGELLGRRVTDIIHPDDRARMLARIARMQVTGEPVPPIEERALARDGRVVTFEVAAIPIVFEGQESFVAVRRDVSQRAELEAKMRQLDRMVAVGTLALGVGHEINNPLAYVMANVEYLEQELDALLADHPAQAPERNDLAQTPERNDADESSELTARTALALRVERLREVLAEIQDGTARIRDIVRDLRDLAQTREGERTPVQLDELLVRALTTTRKAIQAKARIETDFVDDAIVEGDEGRLLQVAVNLLINASHAIPEGAPAQHLVRIETRIEQDKAVFSITDDGVGMSEETLKRIFDPFFTTRPVGQGTGLGLTLAHEIVRAHEGEIRIASELGRGTTFSVVFPLARGVVVPRHEPSRPAVRRSTLPPPASGIVRARILVVDDEVTICHTLERILGDDHDVVSERGGAPALERLRRGERFDLILCDLMMPEVTGLDLFREVEQIDPAQAERFLFLTAGAPPEHAQALITRLADRFVAKPFQMDELRDRVEALVRSREALPLLRGATRG